MMGVISVTYGREAIEGITVQDVRRTADHEFTAGLGKGCQCVQTRNVIDETHIEHFQVVLEKGRDRGLQLDEAILVWQSQYVN